MSSGSAAEEGSLPGSEDASDSELEGSEEDSSDATEEEGSTAGSEEDSELGSALCVAEEEGSAELLEATGADELEEIGALAHPHNKSAHANKMIRFMVVGKRRKEPSDAPGSVQSN